MTETAGPECLSFDCETDVLTGIDDYAYEHKLASRAEAVVLLLKEALAPGKHVGSWIKGDKGKITLRLSAETLRQLKVAAAVNDRSPSEELANRLVKTRGRQIGSPTNYHNYDQPLSNFSLPIDIHFELEREADLAGRTVAQEVAARLTYSLRMAIRRG